MVKVGVVGYGTIGQRVADGVALQKDMELVGVSDVAPTLPVMALKERGMPYALYNAATENSGLFKASGIPVSGTLEELVETSDIILDATSAGIGAENKKIYKKYGKKAVFQGGEKNDVADVFFHGYANYKNGLGAEFLKLTSCNTTGFIRAIDCLDRLVGVEKVAVTIIRRVADPGDYNRGLTNALQVDKAPNHQCVDLMTIMPHIDATGILVHTPVTHGHIITLVVTPKKDISPEDAIAAFRQHDRIRVVSLDEGFLGNASLFKYARDLGNPRGDMYEIALWTDTVVKFGKDLMFAINIPIDLGDMQTTFITDRSLDAFIPSAKEYLETYPDRIVCPIDLAFEKNGQRVQLDIDELPGEALFPDIGDKTISLFREEIRKAGTLFVNGPPGMYENPLFETGTRDVFRAISRADGYSVIGGGDSVTAAARYVNLDSINYICTAGGAMVRFLSSAKLPLLKAMENAYTRI